MSDNVYRTHGALHESVHAQISSADGSQSVCNQIICFQLSYTRYIHAIYMLDGVRQSTLDTT